MTPRGDKATDYLNACGGYRSKFLVVSTDVSSFSCTFAGFCCLFVETDEDIAVYPRDEANRFVLS